MTNPIPRTGGTANEDFDLPGEFNAGPGYMADELGIPAGLPLPSEYQTGYTLRQQTAPLPGRPISPAKAAQSIRATDSWDPNAEPDPFSLGQ